MKSVFLSASVPIVGRGTYYQTSDPFLIQYAVREFVIAALGRCRIVWGGHPAITPMVWAVCEDLGVDYERAVVLYQSRYFVGRFPEENTHFTNVEYVEAVDNNLDASLTRLREAMLSRNDLDAAVFIGGMEGVTDEHKQFVTLHPHAHVLPVPAPGGAALQLAQELGIVSEGETYNLDFAGLFHRELGIDPTAPRDLV
jgi:hypothetical protein